MPASANRRSAALSGRLRKRSLALQLGLLLRTSQAEFPPDWFVDSVVLASPSRLLLTYIASAESAKRRLYRWEPGWRAVCGRLQSQWLRGIPTCFMIVKSFATTWLQCTCAQ